jgi:hypothetical protein
MHYYKYYFPSILYFLKLSLYIFYIVFIIFVNIFYSIILQPILARIAHNVPAVWKLLAQQSESFGGPNKQTRSVCRADKMWVE